MDMKIARTRSRRRARRHPDAAPADARAYAAEPLERRLLLAAVPAPGATVHAAASAVVTFADLADSHQGQEPPKQQQQQQRQGSPFDEAAAGSAPGAALASPGPTTNFAAMFDIPKVGETFRVSPP